MCLGFGGRESDAIEALRGYGAGSGVVYMGDAHTHMWATLVRRSITLPGKSSAWLSARRKKHPFEPRPASAADSLRMGRACGRYTIECGRKRGVGRVILSTK